MCPGRRGQIRLLGDDARGSFDKVLAFYVNLLESDERDSQTLGRQTTSLVTEGVFHLGIAASNRRLPSSSLFRGCKRYAAQHFSGSGGANLGEVAETTSCGQGGALEEVGDLYEFVGIGALIATGADRGGYGV